VIVVIVRTLNEERHIARFCEGYAWANLILVADGGSTDQTKEIAARFGNVKMRDFTERLELPGGGFMNPEPAHVNFLIDWAVTEGATWIVKDDCDCWPNPALKDKVWDLFRWATVEDAHGLMVTRLYMWGETEHFPRISEAGPALWAWRPDKVDCRVEESSPTFFDAILPGPDPDRCIKLQPPYVLLHYFEPDKKADRYKAWGKPQTPIEKSMYWPPEPLPAWAR
jgi:glycosyltransferase involved in cell wall biosynthesis